MRTEWAIVAVGLMVVGQPVMAKFSVGFGNSSCEQWIDRFDGDKFSAYAALAWVTGYISGVNSQITDKDIVKITDAAAIDDAIEKYCKIHPEDNITEAAHDVINQLQMRAK